MTSTDITGRAASYGYDSTGRLTSETITGDPRGAAHNGAIIYVLDAVANRVSRTSATVDVPSTAYSYNANDQLTSDTYDQNGNTIAANGATFTYDFENRLISKNNGAVIITYDGDGDRIAKTAGGVTTRYLVDDQNPTGYVQVMEEISGGGAVQVRYVFGSALVSQTRNVSGEPATSYYGYDAHGNIAFLTDEDAAVTDRYSYDAWGVQVARTGMTPNTRLYAGEELDQDVGAMSLRARQYSPESGRFLTIDPAAGRPSIPVSLHRYVYANAAPTQFKDASGMAAAAEYGGVGVAALDSLGCNARRSRLG